MSGTALDHRLVLAYLGRLELASRGLPAAQARELKEQITAHLEDALRPGADDAEVIAVLAQLGSAAEVASQAASGPPRPGSADLAWLAATARGLIGARLARIRRRTWVIVGVAVILIGTGLTYLGMLLSAQTLQFDGASRWWFRQDYMHAVFTQADVSSQTTVPVRSGHWQGFVVSIYNPSNWTQTVLAPPPLVFWDSLGNRSARIGVSVFNPYVNRGGFTKDIRFTLPGSIPPHQIRLLRVLWFSDACMTGGSEGFDQLLLRVRVGWFTRTEVIPLDQGWFLSGPSQASCRE